MFSGRTSFWSFCDFISYKIEEQIKEFAHEKLAQNIYHNVESPHNPRDKIDWDIAELILKKHLDSDRLRRMGRQFLILKSYEIHRRQNQALPPISSSMINYENYSEEFSRICNTMEELGVKAYTSLVFQAIEEISDHAFLDLVLGKYIWKYFFVPETYNYTTAYKEFYSNVLFG